MAVQILGVPRRVGGDVGHEKPLDGHQTLFHGPHVCESLTDLFGRVDGPHGRFWAVCAVGVLAEFRSEPSEPFGGQDLAHGGLGASLPLGDDRLGESEVVVRDDPLVQRIGVLVDVPHAHFTLQSPCFRRFPLP